MDISTITKTAKFAASRGTLILKKHSPEILLGAGIVANGAAVVLTCKATLKVDDILTEAKANQDKIENVHNGEVTIPEDMSYSDEDYKRDKAIVKINTAKSLAKLYAPAITCYIFSIGCILASYGIMKKRTVALLGLYTACQERFDAYRDRVRDELGEEKEHHFYYDTEEEVVSKKVEGEDGKKKTVKETIRKYPYNASQYSRWFDEANDNWSASPEQNKYFLERVQQELNQRLRLNGHVFLNEAYELLGFEDSSDGAIVGWILNSEEGDNYIDMNIFDAFTEARRRFVNNDEPSILLDFNVQGIIYDLI